MNPIEQTHMMKIICRFIDEHLDEPYSVAELAKLSGYCHQRFSRILKDMAGVSPSLFIRLRKVEKTKEWLVHSEMTITEISVRLGYSSISNFSRMFQSTVGMSPASYRNKFSIRFNHDKQWFNDE